MKVLVITCATILFLLCQATNPLLADAGQAPQVSSDGLHKVPDSRYALVYADPEADFTVYQKILLVDVQVAFKKNWRSDTNRARPYLVTPDDMLKIRTELSELFQEILSQELKSAGFVLTESQADDVMIVRPAILDLNVQSPDLGAGQVRNLTETAGDMFLYLELRDSVSGDILAKALDYQVDRSRVTTFMRDHTRNEMAARKILTGWAQTLTEGLNEIMRNGAGDQSAD